MSNNFPSSRLSFSAFNWALRKGLPEDIEWVPLSGGMLNDQKFHYMEVITNVPIEYQWEEESSAFLETQAYFVNFFQSASLKRFDTFFFSEPLMSIRREGGEIIMSVKWSEAPKTEGNKKMMKRWLK